MTAATDEQSLSLPGYTLSTRLGAGGYGEVWLAQAPGGLTKAVKFIFGSFHEKRAEHELKALQRIKDLRHPFLLSLERIEVVDGRLVIVTELAEGSLKDRFDSCQHEGLRGILREELLGYLEDAADALDFLSQKHSLQHLDVKPENLLLLAGHVKVADFGLVKDIGNSQASMVGGLTPLYSAPEVFQGNPSARSDQYSLAILYQEMLTGILPFAGVTAAELTMQHLHDEPDMSPLPIADRYVLARALSKDPESRFGSCKEFVQALVQAPSSDGNWSAETNDAGQVRTFESALPERRNNPRSGPVTEFFDEQIKTPRKEVSASMLLDWEPPAATEPLCLPAIELTAAEFRAQPTLVIGVGGSAAGVLKQFRQRIAKEFGEVETPAIQLLLLDSDPKAIAQALQGDPRSTLKAEETLALPLRRPQEYREQSAKLMRWLSRRWLYNIPKSLRTEGLRPLGRLAFADHARQAVQRLRMSLAQATAPESIAVSESCGVALRPNAVRVYVVASASGGAGSGMSLDVAYAVRTALEKANIPDAQIIGIMLHSSGRDPQRCDLARVNAYAWLTEYNHFHRPSGEFPGDESCGLPPRANGKGAFDSAYWVDFNGDDADDKEAAVGVAEYIYLDALTPAQRFFDSCRQQPCAAETSEAPLRTFTLRKISAAASSSIESAAARIARDVVLSWTGGEEALKASAAPHAAVKDGSRDTSQLVLGAATLVGQLQLKLEGLASNAREVIEAQFGGDLPAFVDNLLQLEVQDGAPMTLGGANRLIDCVFGVPKDQSEGRYVLQRPLEVMVSPLSMKLAGDLARWVLGKLDDRQERLNGAHGAAQWLVDHLTRLDADATRLASALRCADCRRSRGNACGPDVPANGIVSQATNYFRLCVDHCAVAASSIIARRLLAELRSVSQTVLEFGRHLRHVAMNLPASQPTKTPDPVEEALLKHMAELTEIVDENVQKGFIAANGGLLQTIMGSSRVRAQLLAELSKQSQRAAEQLTARPEVMKASWGTDRSRAAGAVDSNCNGVPKLLENGGSYRNLAIIPNGSANAAKIAAEGLGPKTTVVEGVGSDIILCQEGWDLPLVRVAVDAIQNRKDYADFAGRVVTRCDVSWTPLAAPRVTPFPTFGDSSLSSGVPTVTQVL